MTTANRPLRVLFVASEVAGFVKTGGLADVAAALPRALVQRGVDVRVVMPLYRGTHRAAKSPQETNVTIEIALGVNSYPGRVWWSHLPGSEVPIYLIEQAHFFERDDPEAGRGLYQFSDLGGKRDYPDNAERYIYFSRAVMDMLPGLDFWPDVIHVNDWQSALVPVYLRELYGRAQHRYENIRTLLTIHNIAYQGQFAPDIMGLTGLDSGLFRYDKLEFYGRFCFLKGGIVYADYLNTVSPRYAGEIQTTAFACGLESTLSSRRHHLCGIVNGVDYSEWDPAIDPHLPVKYDRHTVFEGKPENKAALQRYFRLPEWPRTPIFGLVARLAEQKGIDLLLEVGEQILQRDAQLVVLGEGDPHYHYWLQQLRDRYPQRVGVYFGFSEPLAHLIEAGADSFLMPSKYEPSGLNQLYSLRYGTVPVVRDVGGLHDTIADANEHNLANGTATGFRFGPYTGPAFLSAVDRAMNVYRHHQDIWRRIMITGMNQDWSWQRSAGEYEDLYRRIVGQ